MANEPLITWKTTGKTLASSKESEIRIDVTENPQSFTMPDSEGPYGVPVDAPLAVTLIKQLWEKVQKEPKDNPLRRLMEGSIAITLDKNVLLKTISQPQCEGIRFYLCLKTNEAKEEVLSLVTVGVDAKGKDLLYDFQTGVPVEDIPTRSLVAEYGHPPTLLQSSGGNLDPFVLFKYSQ